MDPVDSVIKAIQATAKHCEWKATNYPETNMHVLAHIEKEIAQLTAKLRETHAASINAVAGAKSAPTGATQSANDRFYERTMKSLYNAHTQDAFDAMVALGRLMSLWQMRCTYRIALTEQPVVYSEDV